MAPTEATILDSFLLTPSQLPAIISLQEFTALFPKSQQSSPHIRSLYRDLQARRNAVVDTVAANIQNEAKRGKAMRREVVQSRREAEGQDYDDELEIEKTLFGPSAGPGPKHSLNSVLPELEAAIADVEAEVQQLETEEAELLQQVKQTVGSLSDLRYGRFANGQLRDQVIEGLKDVQETCKRTT